MIRVVASRASAMPDEVASYLLRLVRRRGITFLEMAAWSRRHFGAGGPDAGEIATYLGVVLNGDTQLNRLGRDIELAEWVAANARAGTLDELLDAIRVRFGAARTPSRSALGRFLRDGLGRRGRMPDPQRLAFSLKLVRMLREMAPGRSLADLRDLCVARFGDDLAPSKSEVHRLLQREKISFGRSRARRYEAEVWTWLRWAIGHWSVSEARRRAIALFGEHRVPSRHVIDRRLPKPRGEGVDVRRFRASRDREVMDALRALVGTMPTSRLHGELLARFGVDRAPKRSSLYRLVPLVLLDQR